MVEGQEFLEGLNKKIAVDSDCKDRIAVTDEEGKIIGTFGNPGA